MNKVALSTLSLYVVVCVTGAAVLVIEILGTRVLSPFYGSTIYVWSSLITVTLGALSLGYFLGGKIIDRYPTPYALFIAIAAAAVFVLLPMKINQWVLPYTDSLGTAGGSLAAAALLFTAPLFLLGMTSPMVIRLLSSTIGAAGSVAGNIFAMGTIGSIAGALLSGFYLLPLFSLTTIFSLTAAILFAVALLVLAVAKGIPFDRSARTLLVFLITAGAVYTAPAYALSDTYTYELFHAEQSHYGDLKVMSVGGSFCLALNGFTQSCSDASGIASFGNVGELAEPANKGFASAQAPFRVLLLGLGAGDIPRSLTPEMPVDIVEIDPQIAQLAEEYFHFAPTASQRVFIDDARAYLRASDTQYDVILFDAYSGGQLPPHLITKEALELYAAHLKSDGVLVMNIATRPSAEDPLFASVVRTTESVFPSVSITAAYPEEEDYLQSLIFYASRNNGYVPPVSEVYAPLSLNDAMRTKGVVLTDEYLPVDHAIADDFALFRQKMKSFGGYRPFFSI